MIFLIFYLVAYRNQYRQYLEHVQLNVSQSLVRHVYWAT